MSQSPVNIVYPIDGATYPIIDPDCDVKSAYFTGWFRMHLRRRARKREMGL